MAVKMKSIIGLFFCLLFFYGEISLSQPSVNNNQNGNEPVNAILPSDISEIKAGNELLINRNFEDAIDYYKKAISKNKAISYYNLGVSYFILGDYKHSEEYFKLSLEVKPDFHEAQINLASTYLMLDKIIEAEKIIDKYVDREKSTKIYINAGNLYLKKRETAKAYYYFSKARKIDSESSFVKLAYANFLVSIGDVDRGISILNSIDGEDYFKFYNLGEIYFKLEDYHNSIRYLRAALEYRDSPDVYKLLAKNYKRLDKDDLAVEALKSLVELEKTHNNYYQYAIGLFCIGKVSKAKKEVYKLISLDPQNISYHSLLYDFLFYSDEKKKALDYVFRQYEQKRSNSFFYLYIKHLILHGTGKDMTKAYRMISSKDGRNDYIKLANAFYYTQKNDTVKALYYLGGVKNQNIEDYNILRTFNNIKLGKYHDALKYASKIPTLKAEYFWYNYSIYWNLKSKNKIKELVKDQFGLLLFFYKKPDVTVHFSPFLSDLDMAFTFNGTNNDIIKTLLFPILTYPEEAIFFERLGVKLLQGKDPIKALEALDKSLDFTIAIELNNKGVASFIEGDYYAALEMLNKANLTYRNNPIILYNLGLTWLNIGDTAKSMSYFDRSSKNNRYFFPAFVGKAVIFSNRGDKTKSYDAYNHIFNTFKELKNKKDIPPQIIYSKYLADLGLELYDAIIKETVGSNKSSHFLQTVLDVTNYLKSKDISTIKQLVKYDTFRANYVHDFLLLHNSHSSMLANVKNDRYYEYTVNYIRNRHGHETVAGINGVKDKYLTNEDIYYNIHHRNKNRAFKMLAKLSDLDFDFPGLYKASFCYYSWLGDTVNIEGSYTSLTQLNVKNVYTDYYKLIYSIFKKNYNGFIDKIEKFKRDFPTFSKIYIIELVYSFTSNDLNAIYKDIKDLENQGGDFQDLTSLVINIESL